MFRLTLLALFLVTSAASSGEDSFSCAASSIPNITLSNGVQMPQLAFGTAVFSDRDGKVPSNPNFVGFLPEQVYEPVHLALKAGMRHIDTAFIYRTHKMIFHVLAQWFTSGALQRQGVFITSKVFHPPVPIATRDTILDLDHMTPNQVAEAVSRDFEKSLLELGVGYVDLMLLHWPSSMNQKETKDTKETKQERVAAARARRVAAWNVLESYYEKGWARAIGVSNFSQEHLQQLHQDGATIRPMVNQIETSIYIRHESIIQYCRTHDIVVQAYSPLGRGVVNIHKDPVVLEIAKKHNKTPGQVALRFLTQEGFGVAFYSSSSQRIQSNMNMFSFELDKEDMAKLYALNSPQGTWGFPSPHDLD